MFNLVYRFAGKNSWRAPQELIIGTLISQFASYSALFRSLHSSISIEQHEKYLCNPFSHNRKYREYGREMHAPKINCCKTHKPLHFILSYVLSVTQQYRQKTAWKFKYLCNPSSHYGNTENIESTRETQYGEYTHETRTPYLDTWKPNVSISAMLNST